MVVRRGERDVTDPENLSLIVTGHAISKKTQPVATHYNVSGFQEACGICRGAKERKTRGQQDERDAKSAKTSAKNRTETHTATERARQKTG